jgi:hypothetical protein
LPSPRPSSLPTTRRCSLLLPHTTLSRPDADELPPVIYPRLPGRRRADLGRSTDGAWWRPAWVDPHPRILLRHLRAETDPQPRALYRDHADRADIGSYRPDDRDGRGQCVVARNLGRPRRLDPREYGAAAKPYSEALGGGAAGLKIAVVQEGFGHPQSLPQIDAIVHEAAGRFRPEKFRSPRKPHAISEIRVIVGQPSSDIPHACQTTVLCCFRAATSRGAKGGIRFAAVRRARVTRCAWELCSNCTSTPYARRQRIVVDRPV